MPYTHHSHSGQFCGHATNSLAEVIEEARRRRMLLLCMTEHVPRDREEDLYAEEVAAGITPKHLANLYADFHREARRLQASAPPSSLPQLLVGMEIEWQRETTTENQAIVERLLTTYQLDLLVGSVHHLYGIPIDFDRACYERALAAAEQRVIATRDFSSVEVDGQERERQLFADYFDVQYEMLRAVQPPVVGHFDLIRLFSSTPAQDLRVWSQVWAKIARNLGYIADYGGCVEINSSGLRKGLHEPYPKEEIVKLQGRFVLSDDSHGVNQVGTNYQRALKYLENCGVSKLNYLGRHEKTLDERFTGIGVFEIDIKDVWQHEFWTV